jgi:hypothetical protein
VSDGSVAMVLRRAGVSEAVAGYIAPTICTAIQA